MPVGGGTYTASAEFDVRDNPSLTEREPTATALEGGGILVLWGETELRGDTTTDLVGRIFNSDGSPAGEPFLVTSAIDLAQGDGAVAALEGGGFVVVWTNRTTIGFNSEYDVRGQRFDAAGVKVGDEFTVHADLTSFQGHPAVAALDGGGFAVSWTDSDEQDADTSLWGLHARIYGSDGAPADDEFLVNATRAGAQERSAVAGLPGGGFVAMWADASETAPDRYDWAIRGRIFGADGTPGSEFIVNTTALGSQYYPSVALLASGNFVVTWESDYNGEPEIVARLYNSAGQPLTGELPVHAATLDDQQRPVATALPGGGFIIAWESETEASGGEFDAFARIFDPDGNPVGDEFRLHADEPGYQEHPALAALADGTIFAAWGEAGVPGDPGYRIRGRLFAHEATPAIGGSAGPETLTGTAGDDVVLAFGGNDILRLEQGGDDQAEAGGGDDQLYFGTAFDGDDRVDGGSGLDILFVQGGSSIDLSNAPLAGIETLALLSAGDNRFGAASAGAFDYFLGAGELTLGAESRLVVDGSGLAAGEDLRFDGGDESDGSFHLIGGAGDDVLKGGGGEDEIEGGAGGDQLDGGFGADLMEGGAGDDLYRVDNLGDEIVEIAGNGVDHVISKVSFSLIGQDLENLSLTENAAVHGTGNGLDNVIAGGFAANVLDGGAGSDTLYGRDGADVLTDTGGGDDELYGERGSDSISVSRFAGHASSEVLIDGYHDDDVITYFAANFTHDATLLGGDGNDEISVFRGRSITIDAGDGDDRVALNFLGADHSITLGSGVDLLQLQPLVGAYLAGGSIIVTDFAPGAFGDRLELVDYLYSVLSGWDPDSNPFATGHLALVQDNDDSVLRIDRDGSGAGSGFFELVRFKDVAASVLTPFNLGGYPGDGSPAVAGEQYGSGNADLMWGAFGPDSLYALGGNDEVHAAAGDDLVEGGDGRDSLFGQLGDDQLFGEADVDFLVGGQGDDLLDGGDGADLMIGGIGDDTYIVDHDGDHASEDVDAGDDTVRTSMSHRLASNVENLVLTGGGGANGYGNGGANSLTGNGAGNRLDGEGGADRMAGGGGHDLYLVDDPGDVVIELDGGGTDEVESRIDYTLPAHVEKLTLAGSAVTGTGNELANLLVGNAAANVLNGGTGIDKLQGGLGDDFYMIDSSGDQIVEQSEQGTDTARSTANYTLADHVENLILAGGGRINGTGNALANTLTGNDTANTLDGGAGADTLIGGSGHDVYVVDNVGDKVVEGGSGGNDTVQSSVDYSLPTHFERLVLTGTAGRDGRGNSGDNNLTGNSGGNLLNGGSGNDSIDGGAGNDSLYGSLGNDVLKGGTGLDRFLFNTAPGPANVDRILDFSTTDDLVYLARYVFTKAGANGTLNAAAFHQGAAAADASDRIVYDQATGKIFYDSDGTGAAAQILFATVTAGTALTNADFVVYG